MCRFSLYLGSPIRLSTLLTEPSHSLIRQSFRAHERDEPLNGDGFGVAWYAPELGEEPAIFRSTTPAWNNRNLVDLARVVQSPCILAHVRAATPGMAVSEANCHPFRCGRYTFMHNGLVAGFAQIRRALLSTLSDRAFSAIEGSTDSEHLFAVFLDELAGVVHEDPVEHMALALRNAILRVLELTDQQSIDEPSSLNIAVADGRCAVLTRLTTASPDVSETLYIATERRYVCLDGVGQLAPAENGGGAVLVSSEPLTQESSWRTILPNQMVLIRPDRMVELRPWEA